MSERRLDDEQLRQTQKLEALGMLAGGVAHDFNNILAAQFLQLGLLQQHTDLPADVKEALVTLETGAQMAADLTRRLLAFTRRQSMQVQRVDFNQVLTNLLKLLRRVVGEDITLHVELAGQTLWLDADTGMLEQVLMNLVINARDAMPHGGRLLIQTSRVELPETASVPHPEGRPGRFVRLSIQDTGCGMSEEIRRHLFEPFFTTKASGKGTGLGLATVLADIKEHQGWIEVQSQPGQGTTFQVFYPAADAPMPQQLPSGHARHERGTGELILLVEDEERVRAAMLAALRKLGYRVLVAANGPEALAQWQEHGTEIRLLITDMVMPEGMTGMELVQTLRKTKPELPVVLCSGYSQEVIGADATVIFLSKPFNLRRLSTAVRQRLDGRDAC